MTKYVYNHVHVLYMIIAQVSTQSCIMYTHTCCAYINMYICTYTDYKTFRKKKKKTPRPAPLHCHKGEKKKSRRLNVTAPGFGSSSSFGSSGSGGLAMKRSVLHTAPTRGDTHSGRLTTGTYETPMKRKENDLNQSSRELCSMFIFRGDKECQPLGKYDSISLEQKKTFQSFRFPFPTKNDDVSRFRLRPVPHRPPPFVPFSSGWKR